MTASPGRLRGKRISVEIREFSNPTDQRLQKSGGHFVRGDDKQGKVIITMRDAPLDRLFAREGLSGVEYTALQKYKHHWYHAGLEMGLGSVDLNRVFSSDPGGMSGMAKTERQYHHRKLWRDARDPEKGGLTHRQAIVVDNVVCAENSLEVAGFGIGWTNKPQAIAAATEMLRDAGHRLARFWGIG